MLLCLFDDTFLYLVSSYIRETEFFKGLEEVESCVRRGEVNLREAEVTASRPPDYDKKNERIPSHHFEDGDSI